MVHTPHSNILQYSTLILSALGGRSLLLNMGLFLLKVVSYFGFKIKGNYFKTQPPFSCQVFFVWKGLGEQIKL